MSELSEENQILLYWHCKKCLEENAHPQLLEAGWTKIGFQVRCRRHDLNIVNVDFQGQQHPAI